MFFPLLSKPLFLVRYRLIYETMTRTAWDKQKPKFTFALRPVYYEFLRTFSSLTSQKAFVVIRHVDNSSQNHGEIISIFYVIHL